MFIKLFKTCYSAATETLIIYCQSSGNRQKRINIGSPKRLLTSSYFRRCNHGAEQGQNGADSVTIFVLKSQRTGPQKKTQFTSSYFTVRRLEASTLSSLLHLSVSSVMISPWLLQRPVMLFAMQFQ